LSLYVYNPHHLLFQPPPPPPTSYNPRTCSEKGSDLFFALARRLPPLKFLAVTADRQLQQQVAVFGPPNVSLLPPQEDVGGVLSSAALLLAPSVWCEAYGMVVVDALLRGLPVAVSDQGGLAEAGLGVAAVLRVAPMQLPQHAAGPSTSGAAAGADSGSARWQQRVFVEQPESVVGAWADAVRALLLSPGRAERYTAQAAAARAAALRLVGSRNALLGGFKAWLDALPHVA